MNKRENVIVGRQYIVDNRKKHTHTENTEWINLVLREK